MAARLVQIEERRRISTSPLRGDELQVGRDPTCDIILDYARVSRHHAVLRSLGDRHTVSDAGSSNGTTVNGEQVGAEPLLLRDGDLIELAETVTLLYESGPRKGARRAVVAAVVMVLALAAVSGLAVWRLRAPADPVAPSRAEGLARQGHEAFAAGDYPEAKARLREAAGVLFHDGLLDDVPRNAVMEVALRRLGASIGGGVDLWVEFQASLEAVQPPQEEITELEALGCRLNAVAAERMPDCLRERIELVAIELRQDPAGIPPEFSMEVGRRILYEYDIITDALGRRDQFAPMLRTELEAARMPPLLHYLAMVESGYQPSATSPAGAAGLWQFMAPTARQYDMKVGGGVDQRRDPAISTRAAARYLRDLAFEFGGDALLLALASYNRGPNGVRRALKKLDDPFSDRSYWRLVEQGLLPRETSQYVTRFVAMAVTGEAGLPTREALEQAGF